jgi:abequosyltransferase
MIKPLLSICIATYNRANYIGETLESIIPQLTKEVEIVIVDGASTDNTRQVVQSFVKKCNQINYVQLPSKGGVDQDYCKAVEFAKGKMCWLFTDDDILKPGTLEKILVSIQQNFILIIVNSEVRDKNLKFLLQNKSLKIENDEILTENDLDVFFKKSISYISFIGCVIINRDLWIEREKMFYFGTEFIHVGVIFQKPLPGKILLISNPLIAIRYGNALWSTRAFEIGVDKWPKLINSFKYISNDSKISFNLNKFRHWLNSIIFYRAMGSFSIRNYYIVYNNDKYTIFRKFLSLVISLIPISPIKMILLFYYKNFKKENKVTLYDLENIKK